MSEIQDGLPERTTLATAADRSSPAISRPAQDRPAGRHTASLNVLVLTGTSEHPFDRLIGWVNRWYDARAEQGHDITLTLQGGASTLTTHGTMVQMLEVDELRRLAVAADVIVCHGGPGTIHDALSAGVKPIVAPRSSAHGEHVDDHQMRFAAFLEGTASIEAAYDEARLVELLDRALADPLAFLADVESLVSTAAEVDAVGQQIEALVRSGQRVGRRRMSRRFRRTPDGGPLDVLVACSSGGHLRQLWRLQPWLEQHRRSWVTFDTADAVSLLEHETFIAAHSPTTRNIPNLARNTLLAWRLLRRGRPDVIVSSGAGVAVPFFWLSRLFGIATVYIEVFDRVDSATMTGRLCHPVTDQFLVQWEEQEALYRHSVSVGHLL